MFDKSWFSLVNGLSDPVNLSKVSHNERRSHAANL